MSRSAKKGPAIDAKLLKKVEKLNLKRIPPNMARHSGSCVIKRPVVTVACGAKRISRRVINWV